MTDSTPGCGSNSEARKRQAETVGRDAIHVKVDELAQVKAELDRLRGGIEALLADGPDMWQGYDSRDTGHTFLAESVLDFTAELRQLLAGDPDVRDDLMREWER